jgi:hypothetical protein
MPTLVEPYILSNEMLKPGIHMPLKQVPILEPILKLKPAPNLIITDITDTPTDGEDITEEDGEDITDIDGEDMDIGVKL